MTYTVELRLPSSTQYAYANITVSGESVEEIKYRLDTDLEELAVAVGEARRQAQSFFDLGEGGLTGEFVKDEPEAKPSKPWEKKVEKPSAVPAKPWEKGKAGAQAPSAASSNDDDNTLVVSFPYVDEDPSDPEITSYLKERKDFLQNFWVKYKNSLKWNSEARGYKFHHAPTADAKKLLMARLEEFGGEIVSE